MDIKEYISSGNLESYVLGLASEKERQEIELLAAKHAEIRDEIAAIEISMEQYAHAHSQTPPSALKQKIWSAIESENKSETGKPAVAKVIQMAAPAPQSSYSKWLAAASIALLVGSSLLNLFLFNQWTSAREELAQANAAQDVLAQQFEAQQTQFAQTQQEFAFMTQPTTKAVALKGVPAFPEALATVYWNSTSQDVYIKVNNLPTPPSDKQYQLWAIVDGQPVNAGVFDARDNTASMQKMKNFGSAQAFAVTLEQRGGSVAPTMEAMYVIGTI